MHSADTLPGIWIRSAVLGSIWASSEIILGSFLHNLHIPFRSLFLAAIAVSLMVAIGRQWPFKGLFWRAGLICALMKSVSPSGVIFSPMIAIFMQGLIMEFVVRIGGFRTLSFFVGGILAVSWNLVQYILYNLLLFGWQIVHLYQKVFNGLADMLYLSGTNYWLPVYIALVTHVVFGFLGALMGCLLSGGHAPEKNLMPKMNSGGVKKMMKAQKKLRPKRIALLIINIVLFVASLMLIGYIHYPWNLFCALPILVFWFVYYRNSISILKKPGFWILFFVITLLSSITMEQVGGDYNELSLSGFIVGMTINVRALAFVTGLMVIGYELSNERIRKSLMNKSARKLFMAMEAAGSILPAVISRLPSLKYVFLRPRAVFAQQIVHASVWLEELEAAYEPHHNVILITAPIHAGKSSLLSDCLPSLKTAGLKLAGFVCPSVRDNDIHLGYDICNVNDGKRMILGRKGEDRTLRIGDYGIYDSGLEFGLSLLEEESVATADLIIIDEIGPWELAGGGWARALPFLLKKNQKFMIWVVREPLIEAVIKKWNLCNPILLKSVEVNPEEACKRILEEIALKNKG